MVRAFEWFLRYVDVIVALLLAMAVVGLDVIGVASDKVVQNATVATLAVVAIVLLRDRQRSDESVDETHRRLDRIERGALVREVSGAECTRALTEARRQTARWYFKGATGTYVRAVTLPECVASARPFRRPLRFHLEILDPRDEDLCDRYVRFHKALPAGDGSEDSWSVKATRQELYATILAACWYGQRYEFLDIDVCLSTTYSLLRYEESDTCLIITQRGPNFPATIIERGSSTYDCLVSELYASRKQARVLALHKSKDTPLGEEPTPDEIRALFRVLDLALPDDYSEKDVKEVRALALSQTNPYG
ncbi:hypothetical protein J4573_27260 [Actinomadura barringtoniae]|uniref:Uncharacterized protein n=1 Tax=Actinomadura barringtoniae TaxID=1427535 RepID=A0A939PLM3_9ACTN|nr:hypothetical protein [Actinomadura barringtoniae]MBO2450826.1 hypothetical protein [Actinomadura barringtoniae]